MSLARWLPEPTIECRGRGTASPSVLVTLRDLAPAYSVQPNAECLVFFHLGADHWPVSVEFFEPVLGRGVFKVLERMIETPTGEPCGIELKQAHGFIPLSMFELAPILRAFDEAQDRLEPAGV